MIYIQLEKTACSHIAYLLSQCIKGKQFLKHNPLTELAADKVILGSVRNPWDWYVSLWSYSALGNSIIYKSVTNRSIKNAFKTYSGVKNPTNFSSWLQQKLILRSLSTVINSPLGLWSEWKKPVKLWQECYQNLEDSQKFKQWLKLILNSDRAYDLGIGYGQNSLSSFAGLMTYRYCRLYNKDFLENSQNYNILNINRLKDFDREFNILDKTIRVENLELDLIDAIQKSNYQLSPEQLNLINQVPKTNASKHLDSSYYYDRETLDLVAEKDRFLIEKYSYSPPKI